MRASIVEGVNRTLKGMMWKDFSHNGIYRWINLYKSLVREYNNRTHRVEKKLLNTVYSHVEIYKTVGFHVRISKYKHIFEKGYTPIWNTVIFKICDIRRHTR